MATIVTLQGQVLLPDGNGPSSGEIYYELDGNAKDGSGNKILGRGVIHLPDGGDLTGAGKTIVATADLTPGTLKYNVRYTLRDEDGKAQTVDEQWTVPASSPQNIGDLVV